jgi:hypothetical protein
MIMNIELKQALALYITNITDLSDHREGVTLSEVIHLESNGDVNNWLRGLPSCLNVAFYNDECATFADEWVLLDQELLVNNDLEGESLVDVYFKILADFLV